MKRGRVRDIGGHSASCSTIIQTWKAEVKAEVKGGQGRAKVSFVSIAIFFNETKQCLCRFFLHSLSSSTSLHLHFWPCLQWFIWRYIRQTWSGWRGKTRQGLSSGDHYLSIINGLSNHRGHSRTKRRAGKLRAKLIRKLGFEYIMSSLWSHEDTTEQTNRMWCFTKQK